MLVWVQRCLQLEGRSHSQKNRDGIQVLYVPSTKYTTREEVILLVEIDINSITIV